MGNSFEALFKRGGKQDGGEKTAPLGEVADVPEKKETDPLELAKAINVKKEIAEITQGRTFEDLSSEDLKVVLAKYKEIENTLGLSESEPKGGVREQMLRAKEIMGEEFFGPEEIEKAFGIRVNPDRIPGIPFAGENLERARELGQFLILRVDTADDGTPLTMVEINKLLKGKVSGGAKALYDNDGSGQLKDDAWYRGEAFATQDPPRLSWALVGKEVLPDSSNKNYLEQTVEIVDYLKNEVFAGKEIPVEFQSAISEFEKAKDEIGKLIDNDWQKAAKQLEELAITKLTRQTPVEILYDILVYFQNTGDRLLENMYTWTAKRSSGGEFVSVGSFDADGAYVGGADPRDQDVSLGVSFSRSV